MLTMGGRGWVSRENIDVASPVLKKLICSVEPNKATLVEEKGNQVSTDVARQS